LTVEIELLDREPRPGLPRTAGDQIPEREDFLVGVLDVWVEKRIRGIPVVPLGVVTNGAGKYEVLNIQALARKLRLRLYVFDVSKVHVRDF
jgi:hypothetical protein